MLVFLAVWAFMRSSDQVRLFVWVLVAIVFYEAGVALYDRYILGFHRIIATLPHPNSLSMYCLQIFPFMISVWFANDASPRLRKFCLVACFLIAGVTILTISRTGFASLVVLTFLSILLNIRNRLTARNIRIIAMILMVGAGMTYKAWDSLSSRYQGFDFSHEYESEQGDRGKYFRKGWPALKDNPVFGVGLNNWSYWISNRYAAEAGYHTHDPYPSVDDPPYYGQQEAPAHNLYLITAVELGWIGLFLLIALFGRWLYISGSGWMKSDGDFLDRVRLGAFLSLCGVLMQSVTEWEFRQTSLFFMGHITMAVATFIYFHKRSGK
jgi:O-antigen ligase